MENENVTLASSKGSGPFSYFEADPSLSEVSQYLISASIIMPTPLSLYLLSELYFPSVIPISSSIFLMLDSAFSLHLENAASVEYSTHICLLPPESKY